jgi:hypothetical protein
MDLIDSGEDGGANIRPKGSGKTRSPSSRAHPLHTVNCVVPQMKKSDDHQAFPTLYRPGFGALGSKLDQLSMKG